jgi:hypothetical protein
MDTWSQPGHHDVNSALNSHTEVYWSLEYTYAKPTSIVCSIRLIMKGQETQSRTSSTLVRLTTVNLSSTFPCTRTEPSITLAGPLGISGNVVYATKAPSLAGNIRNSKILTSFLSLSSFTFSSESAGNSRQMKVFNGYG